MHILHIAHGKKLCLRERIIDIKYPLNVKNTQNLQFNLPTSYKTLDTLCSCKNRAKIKLF